MSDATGGRNNEAKLDIAGRGVWVSGQKAFNFRLKGVNRLVAIRFGNPKISSLRSQGESEKTRNAL